MTNQYNGDPLQNEIIVIDDPVEFMNKNLGGLFWKGTPLNGEIVWSTLSTACWGEEWLEEEEDWVEVSSLEALERDPYDEVTTYPIKKGDLVWPVRVPPNTKVLTEDVL